MRVVVAEQYPRIQVCHDGVTYLAGDEADVPELVARSWERNGWVIVLDADDAPPDLSPLEHAVGDLQDAAGQLESAVQTAGSAASPRGGRSGSEATS